MSPRAKKETAPVVEEPEEDILEEPAEEEAEEEQPAPREDTVTFKRSHFYAVMVVLAFAAGVLVGYTAWGVPAAQVAQSGPPAAAGAPPVEAQQVVRYDVSSKGAYALGPEDAPITIVEFSDFQCPYCRRWHEQVYKPLLAAYPGQIRMVYRHLPLTSIHPDAFPAAEASMCAGEQDAFWPYHDKLFSSESLGTAVYTRYAQELSLDMDSFEACLAEGRYRDAIQADSDFAVNLGVRSTPTFFINGLPVVGAQPLSVFQQLIDKELAGEIPE